MISARSSVKWIACLLMVSPLAGCGFGGGEPEKPTLNADSVKADLTEGPAGGLVDSTTNTWPVGTASKATGNQTAPVFPPDAQPSTQSPPVLNGS